MLKGLVAGGVNLALGLAVGGRLPGVADTAAALVVGAVGYGASRALFVAALRGIGAARTGALFAIAPFVGVVVAIGVFDGAVPRWLAPATALTAAGLALHLTEQRAAAG